MSEAVTLATAADGFEVRRLSPHIGAEIHGVDLTQTLSQRYAALLDHKVIFFRTGSHATAALRFARRFGPLEIHPATPPIRRSGSARIAHGAKSRGSENNWHSDVTWRPNPRSAILRAIEVPEFGGDTLFSHVRHLRGAFTGHAGVCTPKPSMTSRACSPSDWRTPRNCVRSTLCSAIRSCGHPGNGASRPVRQHRLYGFHRWPEPQESDWLSAYLILPLDRNMMPLSLGEEFDRILGQPCQHYAASDYFRQCASWSA